MGADVDQALTDLLHDLRSPLGVAHGYLRLVREGRLPTDAARNQALDKTREALGRITQMCVEATTAAARAATSVPSTMPVAEFVDAVRRQLDLPDTELVSSDLAPSARVRLHAESASLASTVASLLRASAQARSDAVLRAETRADMLSFLRGEPTGAADVVVVSLPLENVSA